ncbi:response regulator [Azoarcus sp. KH32C]|uniref:response regulator n=1 Tax=Azoarcus sp. KH32C TaxID=748247 RepID=UPI00023862F4|nr:response regulator [Azoarcus sp. KH32C]BAL26243.1 putative hybrid sensor and regulator protein [Azoarcus sp. KH32C]
MAEQPASSEDRGEILLVDDSAASLRLLSLWLHEAGYAVRQAQSGELALRSIQARSPDLVLLDVRMPGMHGFEVCRRIKADPHSEDVPIIFLSAQDETMDRVEGLRVGAVDFIAKNFAREEVLARVRTHVTLARVKLALRQEQESLEARVRERTAEIERSRALLQHVVDAYPGSVYVKGTDNRYLHVNRAMAAEHGMQPGDMIGMDCGPEPDDDRILARETVRAEETRWSELHGGERIYETYSGPMLDQDGSVFGILRSRHDITERRLAERARQELEEQLWHAQKMEAIGQLASGIAHDFNNLLAVILGFAEFAETAVKAGRYEKLGGHVTEILQASRVGKDLVAQLLSFSRSETAEAAPIDVGPLVTEVVRLLRSTLGDDLPVRLRLDPLLPLVKIRPVHLHQILMNLGINIRDACRSRGNADIRVTLERLPALRRCASCHMDFDGEFVRLTVVDDGPGISPENLPRIFDPFFSTKDVGKGTGLGLSVIHGIVHSAGGHIQVESHLGRGTRFDIYLPGCGVRSEHAAAGDELPVRRRLSGRVLVVDDEKSIAALEKGLFESAGCEVVATTDPDAALEMVRADPARFDLALIDQVMPGLSGVELAQELLSRRPDLPIVMCSGSDVPPDAAAGIRRVLVKPVSGNELLRIVGELLPEVAH